MKITNLVCTMHFWISFIIYAQSQKIGGRFRDLNGEFIITYNYHNFHDQIIQGFMILRKIAENDNNNNKKKL
jgi:hypothetical protein